MINKRNTLGLSVLTCLILMVFLSGTIAFAQDQDDALKKKYAPILGEFEFDLAEYGGDVQILTFRIESGDIWIDSGDGDPAAMKAVEGAEFEFTVTASDGMELGIKFVKNDEGNYTLCEIDVLSQGIVITGTKIK
jgi:hypothetical protein